jgi:hypothetical protein
LIVLEQQQSYWQQPQSVKDSSQYYQKPSFYLNDEQEQQNPIQQQQQPNIPYTQSQPNIPSTYGDSSITTTPSPQKLVKKQLPFDYDVYIYIPVPDVYEPRVHRLSEKQLRRQRGRTNLPKYGRQLSEGSEVDPEYPPMNEMDVNL